MENHFPNGNVYTVQQPIYLLQNTKILYPRSTFSRSSTFFFGFYLKLRSSIPIARLFMYIGIKTDTVFCLKLVVSKWQVLVVFVTLFLTIAPCTCDTHRKFVFLIYCRPHRYSESIRFIKRSTEVPIRYYISSECASYQWSLSNYRSRLNSKLECVRFWCKIFLYING